MPSSSSFTASEKAIIKHVLPSDHNKILAAGLCRIYYAYPDPNKCLSGALVFGRPSSGIAGSFWFKLIDLSGTRGTIWEHEVYEDGPGRPGHGHFGYHQERTFWHTFQGDDCMIAFVFVNEDEASAIHKKVINRSKYTSKSAAKVKPVEAPLPAAPTPVLAPSGKKKGAIDKSMISAPTDFKRVAHMGYDSNEGFTAENVDPSWAQLLTNLTNMGFSKDEINNSESFIKDYVNQAGGIDQVLSSHNNTSASPPTRVPPPPANPITSKRVKPPAPPAPTRRTGTSNENHNPATPAPSARVPSAPSRAPPIAAAPSRPPPTMPVTPAPSAPVSNPPAPPTAPPPPTPHGASAHPSDSANPLSQSTRSIGSAEDHDGGGGGGNLAASLAAALNKRKGTMGEDSEEEAESDDEWD
ncbi:hypothetical protein PtB15_17B250 [Puccinia triticina]|nr:hypothetical protein PtB15_17B250 [Puccinia triticina]